MKLWTTISPAMALAGAMPWLILALALAATPHAQARGKPGGSQPITVRLSWDYHNLDARMEVYEVADGAGMWLWEMGAVKDIDELGIGKHTKNNLPLRPDNIKLLVLVLRNPGNQPLYFFAAPHQANPPSLGIGFRFQCLCVNHLYKVPPRSVWYRVVGLTMYRSFPGGAFELRHVLVGVPPDRAAEMMKWMNQ